MHQVADVESDGTRFGINHLYLKFIFGDVVAQLISETAPGDSIGDGIGFSLGVGIGFEVGLRKTMLRVGKPWVGDGIHIPFLDILETNASGIFGNILVGLTLPLAVIDLDSLSHWGSRIGHGGIKDRTRNKNDARKPFRIEIEIMGIFRIELASHRWFGDYTNSNRIIQRHLHHHPI